MFTCTGYDISVTHVRVDNADVWNNGSNTAQLAYLRQDTITDSKTNYPSSHAVVEYAEPKKGEWVLKGTMTDPNGIDVDLTGCTELIIKGDAVATGNVHLATNKGSLCNNAFTTSIRVVYAKWVDGLFGIDNIFAKRNSAVTSNIGDNLSAFANTSGWKVNQISRVYLNTPSNITSCNIEIYAR